MSEMHEFGMNSIVEGSATGSDVRSLASSYTPVASFLETKACAAVAPQATSESPNLYACASVAPVATSFAHSSSGPGSSKGSIQSRSLTFTVKDAERAAGNTNLSVVNCFCFVKIVSAVGLLISLAGGPVCLGS